MTIIGLHNGFERVRLKLQAEFDARKTQVERNRLGQFATPTAFALDILNYAATLIPDGEKIRLSSKVALGKRIGVQKSGVSRIESNASNVTIDTLMRVFNALQAKVKFQVELPYFKISVGQ